MIWTKQEAGRRKHAADEGQQQEDRGQRHAALGGEEKRQAPGGRGDGERREEARPGLAMVADEQPGGLANALADPADREQQDRRGDRDENVVEAGDEPELLFIRDGGRALAFDIGAQARRRHRR